MLQALNIEEIFREYFQIAIVPDRIIELGTMSGKFTHIIHALRSENDNNFDLITFDQRRDVRAEYLPWNMIFCQMDIFLNMDFIINLIKPRTLILCDNGNKIKEVQSLAPHLKQDCVIMAHDYFHDKYAFEHQIGWTACEITWSDVEHLGLSPYHQDIMEKGYWLSLTNIK
jgi:hypothetical protein